MHGMFVHNWTSVRVCWQVHIYVCVWERERQERQMWKRKCVCVCVCFCLCCELICSSCVLLWQWGTPRAGNVAFDKALVYWSHTHTFTHTDTLQLMVTGRSKHEWRGRNEREGLSRWVWRDLDLNQLEEKRERGGGSNRVQWMSHWACKCLTVPY